MSHQASSMDDPSRRGAVASDEAGLSRPEGDPRIAALLRNLPGIVYRCRNDEHWTMEYVSQGCYRLTGYRPDELLENRRIGFNELIHPDDRSSVRDQIRLGLASQRQFQVTYRIRTADGEEKHVWEQGVAILSDDGRVVALEGFITDITEQKRAEAALQLLKGQLEQDVQDRTAELQAIYDGMVDGVLIADVETKHFLMGNAAAAEMLGYEPEEVPSLSLSEIHPAEHLAWIQERFREHVEDRRNRTSDMPFRRKDGSVFYGDITSSPIVYHGRPCLIGFLRDVTQRRQAEEALRREKETLRLLLSSSDHERQLIAYEIHDTVAQDLAGAVMYLQGYQQLRETDSERAAETLETAMRVLRECQAEVRRLIAGVRPVNLDETGVEGALQYLVRSVQRESGPKIEYQSRVRFHRLEPIQENAVYRIAEEGLRNACRHSHSPRVRVELLQTDDRLRLSVQDWGRGFDVASVSSQRFGLESIRARARLLGGHADIRSRPSEGTCVTVEMPLMVRSEDQGNSNPVEVQNS